MRWQEPFDNLLASGSHIRVWRALVHLPEGFEASAREIARRAGISHPTSARVLSSLVLSGAVTLRRRGNADSYRLNGEWVFVQQLRALFDAESQLRETLFAELGFEIKRSAPHVRAAYVFGSAARRDSVPESDLDLAVLCSAKDEDVVWDEIAQVSAAVRRRFGCDVDVVVGSGSLESLRRSSARRLWEMVATEGVRVFDAAHWQAG
jgi:predicted nucleotidyltransferase